MAMTNRVVFYRGFSEYFSNGTQKNVFRNTPRCPTNTNKFVHEVADDWFNKNFGVFARSKTVLCSSDFAQAAKYKSENGSIATINPKGDFRIIYSESVVDFLNYVFDIEKITATNIENWLQQSDYKCIKNLMEMPPCFKGEVMIDCDSYELTNLWEPDANRVDGSI